MEPNSWSCNNPNQQKKLRRSSKLWCCDDVLWCWKWLCETTSYQLQATGSVLWSSMVQVELLPATVFSLHNLHVSCVWESVKWNFSVQCSTNSLMGDNDQQELEQEHVEEECWVVSAGGEMYRRKVSETRSQLWLWWLRHTAQFLVPSPLTPTVSCDDSDQAVTTVSEDKIRSSKVLTLK